jgi:single-strand DNA-binding protein
MNNLNSFLIEGILTEDPVKDGNKCTFTIQSSGFFVEDGEKKEELNYFNVEAWNKNAKFCFKILSKGRGVRVVGRLRAVTSAWCVVAENVELKSKLDK